MQELEKILEEIGELRGQAGSECTSEDHYIKKAWEHCLDRVVGIILKHMNDGWISVQDKLPEYDVDVLITYADIDDENYTDICITTYGYAYLGGHKLDFKEWRSPFEYFKTNYKVIAWRPLLEPYRPEKERGRMRLIDADELTKDRVENDPVRIAAECAPTAFDKENVIEELREELNLSDAEKERCARENPLQFDSAKGYANGIANAIEIVEKGGIE